MGISTEDEFELEKENLNFYSHELSNYTRRINSLIDKIIEEREYYQKMEMLYKEAYQNIMEYLHKK